MMNRTTSIYLDLIRFLAAVAVFNLHANYERLTGGLPILWRVAATGYDAVMVFFVLSGLVIAYVVHAKEKTLTDYSLSRLARLYSVALPALVLTVILDTIGSRCDPGLYVAPWFLGDDPVWRFVANLFFINELWFWSVRPFSNGPYWSLGYEFWYYAIFAAWFYTRGGATRCLALAVTGLIVGPKILSLFPIWLLGVWVYARITTKPVNEFSGWFLFLGTIGGYVIYRWSSLSDAVLGQSTPWLGEWIVGGDQMPGQLLHNYVVGVLVALHFVGVSGIASRIAAISRFVEVPIRYLAGFTFAIYLFHYPLLQFFAAVSNASSIPETLRGTVVLSGTILAIWALGTVTEKQKSALKSLLAAGFNAMGRRFLSSS